jgi:2-oxo-hept-3-ene-1,7-dioate hydratase
VLSDAEAIEFAERIAEADRTKTPTRQISQLRPDLTIDDAYAIQRAGVAIAERQGRVVGARKIGLTSKVMQDTVGIDEPDHGVIYRDMMYVDGDTVAFDRFIAPRVEVELAFVLSADLTGPDCSLADVLAATDYVCPAIELLDARIQMKDPETGSTRTIVDTISDNAADAGIVVGTQRLDPAEIDLPWVCAVLRRNGQIEESGVAAAVLDHPARGVAWLANRLHRHGVSLRPGELILAGSFTRILWVNRGDDFVAEYGSSSGPLGTVEFGFR